MLAYNSLGKSWESDEGKEERVDSSMTNILSKQKGIYTRG